MPNWPQLAPTCERISGSVKKKVTYWAFSGAVVAVVVVLLASCVSTDTSSLHTPTEEFNKRSPALTETAKVELSLAPVSDDTETEPTISPTAPPTTEATETEPAQDMTDENYVDRNLISVLHADKKEVDIHNGIDLDELIDKLVLDITEINHVSQGQIKLFTTANNFSSGFSILQIEEKANGRLDIWGETIDAPETLTFKYEEDGLALDLMVDESSRGYGVYTDGENRYLLPLQFSLIGETLDNQEIAGVIPYSVAGEKGLRLAIITQSTQGEFEFNLGSHGIPHVLNEPNRLASDEQIVRDENGQILIQNEQGEKIRCYNPDRGEWELTTQEMELAKESVDFLTTVEGEYQGIPYEFTLGIDFIEDLYDRYPIENIDLNNEQLMGQMVFWLHYKNWLMSQGIINTGGPGYWRATYRISDGWTRSSEEDMQRFVDQVTTAKQGATFEDYIQMVKDGNGGYTIFGRGAEGGYDFQSVDPRQGLNYIREERRSSGKWVYYNGTYDFNYGIRVENGKLTTILEGGETYKEYLNHYLHYRDQLLEHQGIREALDNDQEAIEKLATIAERGGKSIWMLTRFPNVYIAPTLTPRSLDNGHIGTLPQGRIFLKLFQEKTISSIGTPYYEGTFSWYFPYKGLITDVDRLDYPLEVVLSEGF
jgi:hypothetical protein